MDKIPETMITEKHTELSQWCSLLALWTQYKTKRQILRTFYHHCNLTAIVINCRLSEFEATVRVNGLWSDKVIQEISIRSLSHILGIIPSRQYRLDTNELDNAKLLLTKYF